METANDLLEKIWRGEKVSFMEYLIALRSYGELEFSYKGNVYVTLRLNNEYSFNNEEWDRSKDFYVLFENANYKNAQIFRTIEEAHDNAKLDGQLVKDIFGEMTGVGELGIESWHGFRTHDHKWYGKDRGPARKPDYKNFPD